DVAHDLGTHAVAIPDSRGSDGGGGVERKQRPLDHHSTSTAGNEAGDPTARTITRRAAPPCASCSAISQRSAGRYSSALSGHSTSTIWSGAGNSSHPSSQTSSGSSSR